MPSTTNLFVEIFAIGSFASVWLSLFLMRYTTLENILLTLTRYEGLTVLIVFVSAALIYQLGWLMHWFGLIVARIFLEPYRTHLFRQSRVTYTAIRPRLYQHIPEALATE